MKPIKWVKVTKCKRNQRISHEGRVICFMAHVCVHGFEGACMQVYARW